MSKLIQVLGVRMDGINYRNVCFKSVLGNNTKRGVAFALVEKNGEQVLVDRPCPCEIVAGWGVYVANNMLEQIVGC